MDINAFNYCGALETLNSHNPKYWDGGGGSKSEPGDEGGKTSESTAFVRRQMGRKEQLGPILSYFTIETLQRGGKTMKEKGGTRKWQSWGEEAGLKRCEAWGRRERCSKRLKSLRVSMERSFYSNL